MYGQPTLRISSLWGQLPISHRRWIVTRALVATAAINVILNAANAWLSVKGQQTVPLWEDPLEGPSIVSNVVATLFLLPLITCVLTTAAVRRDVRLGSLASLSRLRAAYGWLAALPPSLLRRGVAFGAIAVAALAPPLILALAASGAAEFTRGQFVVGQTAFAVVLGAIFTPVIALYAMADPAERSPADSPA